MVGKLAEFFDRNSERHGRKGLKISIRYQKTTVNR